MIFDKDRKHFIARWKQSLLSAVVLIIILTCLYYNSAEKLTQNDIKISLNIDNHGNVKERPLPCNIKEIDFKPEEISATSRKGLKNVVPMWPSTKEDRCIANIKVKPTAFSMQENENLRKCVEKLKDVQNIKKVSLDRLFRSSTTITHTYFEGLKTRKNVSVIEIGGYTGVLAPKLVKSTGAKHYVALEPVPSFYKKFTDKMRQLSLSSIVTAYDIGLGRNSKELQIAIHSDATSLLKDDTRKGVKTETIKIVKVIDFFVQLGLGCNTLNLLTINCEGCEFDVMEVLASSNLIEQIEYVQIQPHGHVFSSESDYVCRYCRLRGLLSRTHTIGYEFPHIWETWKRKDIP